MEGPPGTILDRQPGNVFDSNYSGKLGHLAPPFFGAVTIPLKRWGGLHEPFRLGSQTDAAICSRPTPYVLLQIFADILGNGFIDCLDG